jgi:hypothetical protein
MGFYSCNECVMFSIANLLLMNGDRKTATRFCQGYYQHPFVLKSGGVPSSLMPRLVFDLTEGSYVALVYIQVPKNGKETPREKESRDNWRRISELYSFPLKILQAIDEDVKRGLIKIVDHKVSIDQPHLLFIKNSPIRQRKRSGEGYAWVVDGWVKGNDLTHCLIDTGNDDIFIDDGMKVRYNRSEQIVTGLLELKKPERLLPDQKRF